MERVVDGQTLAVVAHDQSPVARVAERGLGRVASERRVRRRGSGRPRSGRRARSAGDPGVACNPGGAESRAAVAARYARGFRIVLERPEPAILVVAHSLPIRYLLNALEGRAPEQRAQTVDYASVHRATRDELAAAIEIIERWAAAPRWAA